uniref:Sushi domain-containing protein n=1 Tax=Varanus komodoensis TaxID=61221 RepID=A0A8D2L7E0_VARKO
GSFFCKLYCSLILAISCPKLSAPENGELNCLHPYGDFAYSSRCLPFPPSAKRCPSLQNPTNGRMACLHPHGNFAYGSSCNFSCSGGFQLAGPERLECTARGDWTKKQPRCEAVRCPALEDPAHGRSACSHPYGHFAYRSSCVFSCRSGFELLGPEMLNCTDQGNWTGAAPTCEGLGGGLGAADCSPPLQGVPPESLCHPRRIRGGQVLRSLGLRFGPASGIQAPWLLLSPAFSSRYSAACGITCSSSVRGGPPSARLRNALAFPPHALSSPPATRCPGLLAPLNGHMNCTHPHGDFSFDSGCSFSCDVGFSRVGPEMLQCTPLGEWTKTVPTCEGQGRSALGGPNPGRANMKLRCSSPWAPFSYGSACEFSCPEGYVLNGTKQMQCQADGSWSAAMPLCQGTPVGFQRRDDLLVLKDPHSYISIAEVL